MSDIRPSPWLRFDFHADVSDADASSVETSCEPLIFTRPSQIIVARRTDEVLPALRRVQDAVNAGNYAAGYVGYEAAPAFDWAMRVQSADPPSDFPLLWFGIFAQPHLEPEPFPLSGAALEPDPLSEWMPSTTRTQYDRNIDAIREAIARGETYQVNYTLRLRTPLRGEDYALYKRLLRAQQARYGAYLDIGRYRILSASPELFFHRKGTRIVTRPMKGTMARGRWLEEDEERARMLANSAKNRAENIMIVDLLRNDLGRIAVPGSVRVSELFALERYPTVWQLTSTVEADIPVLTTISEIFGALFPCGSVTGAPKIQTMRHIAGLEASPRQVYCGAIGLISPDGTATFNVAIRTLLADTQTQTAEYGVGGGITWDSTAGDEYAELLAKAAVLQADRPEFDLLETLRLENGEFHLLEAHLQRLRDSAAYFGFPDVSEAARMALHGAGERHRGGNWRVRLRVSKLGTTITEEFSLAANPLDPLPFNTVPIVIARSPVNSANPFLNHKTTHRAVYERHLQEARQQNADMYDALLWNERGELTEFTTGNLVVELGGELYTPPRDCGLLAGTLRAELLAQGKIRERLLTRDDLNHATRCWLINSVRGWQPVIFVLGRLIRVPEWFASPKAEFPNVTATLRNPQKTVAEAEAYAASLSVPAQYGSYLEIANMVNEVLTQIKERNLPLFSAVFVHADYFRDYGEEANRIPARTEYNSLFINPQAAAWSDPAGTAASLYKLKFWSTPHPLHVIYHEVGHLFLPQIGEPKKLLARQMTVASAVSRRARENVEEFVSEVFAGLMSGVEYDRDILGLYKRIGGRIP